MSYDYIILDDDLAFTTFLKKQLGRFSYLQFIGSYTQTIEAVKAITRHKPDILFLDMEIDSLNGLDVLEVLEYKPKTIVISGKTEPFREAMALDIIDYIQKPVTDDRLEEALKKITMQSIE